MKVTIENKKGLNKDIKVFIDKKTMSSHIDNKYEATNINPHVVKNNIVFQRLAKPNQILINSSS